MKRIMMIILSFALMSSVAMTVWAGDFEGTKPLLFCVTRIMECSVGGECSEVTAEELGIPSFFRIDFEKKKVSAAKESSDKRESHIGRVERIAGKLVLQGAEAGDREEKVGAGWTLAISEDTGKAVLTASGDNVGFVAFGACIAPW